MLNYMALNDPVAAGFGDIVSWYKSVFPNHGLGSDAALASFIAFDSIA